MARSLIAAHPGHRRCRVHRQLPVRAAAGGRARGAVRRQFLHRPARQRRAPDGQSALRADAPRRDLPALCRGRPDLQSRLPSLAGALPVRSGADDQDQRARRHQHAGPGQAGAGDHPPGQHLGGLRRPAGPPAARGLLGPRQPAGPARLLRRGQALRRDAVLRLSPPARAEDQGRPDLQHLRAAHAPQRRPGGLQLHRPGARRARTSPSTATAPRPAPSATSTSWSRA